MITHRYRVLFFAEQDCLLAFSADLLQLRS